MESGPFTWRPVDLWRERCIEARLARGARRLSIVLARLMELSADGRRDLTCDPSQRYLAAALGTDRTGVRRWLDALAAADLLKIVEPGGGSHDNKTRYQAVLAPIGQGAIRAEIDPSGLAKRRGTNSAKSDPSAEPTFHRPSGVKPGARQGSESALLRGQTRARSRERETRGNEDRGEKGGESPSPETPLQNPGERKEAIRGREPAPPAEALNAHARDPGEDPAEFIRWAPTAPLRDVRVAAYRLFHSADYAALSEDQKDLVAEVLDERKSRP